MSYQSPIDLIMGQMNTSYENGICKAVQDVGVNIDKNELLKALQYDRGQYQKGYADRDSEIVRCRDCKFYTDTQICPVFGMDRYDDWFCADGKRR